MIEYSRFCNRFQGCSVFLYSRFSKCISTFVCLCWALYEYIIIYLVFCFVCNNVHSVSSYYKNLVCTFVHPCIFFATCKCKCSIFVQYCTNSLYQHTITWCFVYDVTTYLKEISCFFLHLVSNGVLTSISNNKTNK